MAFHPIVAQQHCHEPIQGEGKCARHFTGKHRHRREQVQVLQDAGQDWHKAAGVEGAQGSAVCQGLLRAGKDSILLSTKAVLAINNFDSAPCGLRLGFVDFNLTFSPVCPFVKHLCPMFTSH